MIDAITKASRRIISAVSVLEAVMVPEGRYGNAAGADLELFLFDARVEIAPFDGRQAEAAVRAWRKYGKGRHPAKLNFGDCCVYGLAKASGEPVLSKGADFSQTDIGCVDLA